MKIRENLFKAVMALSLVSWTGTAMAADEEDYAAAKAYSVGRTATYTMGATGEIVLKVSLSKGSPYTFVATGANISVDYKYTSDGDTMFDTLATSSADVRSESERAQVSTDDWILASIVKDPDDEEPSDLISPSAYYLVLSGAEGDSVSLTSYASLVNEPIPQGVLESPVAFGTVTTNESSKSSTLTVDDDFYYSVTLTGGERYKFSVTGGTTNAPLRIGCQGADESGTNLVVVSLAAENAPNGIISVRPAVTATYYVSVGGITGSSGQKFTLTGVKDSGRKVSEHTEALIITVGSTTEIQAGARNDTEDAYFDSIIDTTLCKVALTAGHVYEFDSSFATSGNYVMEIYDSTSTMLFQNTAKSPSEIGQRICFAPTAMANYWVGVCQSDVAVATSTTVKIPGQLTVMDLGAATTEADDSPLTGNTLSFVLGTADTTGALQLKADKTGHAFGAMNYVDWYVFATRKGITYNLKATSDNYISSRPMNLSLYTVSAKGVATLVSDLGDPQAGISYTATASATYYVKATLPNGQGCDYPYNLYAWVAGSGYGYLRVGIKGPSDSATWNLKSEAVKYSDGSEILLPAGSVTVQASAATGWTKPADQTVTVIAGLRNDITLKYSDTFDTKDDTLAGATALTLVKATTNQYSRSLWTTDPRDLFKLTVVKGTVYDLRLAITEGAPLMTVYRNLKQATNGTLTGETIASGTDFRFTAQEAGVYYVAVTSQGGADAAYTLSGNSYAVGQVTMDKAAYTVAESATSVAIKFTRTGKDGKIRVRYTTLEGSAKAGVNYKAQSGVLTWADGNNAAQTVTIPLIPSLYATWDENKVFTFQIDTVDSADLGADEFVPLLSANSATVTITEVTKASPGTVLFIGTGSSAVESFVTPAKPTATVSAGEPVTLWVARTNGANQQVGVKVSVTARQATGSEFVETESQELWWNDGDLSNQKVVISTMNPSDSFLADQTFTVTLTAITTAEAKPTLKYPMVTVTVRDPSVVMSSAEAFASDTFKNTGITFTDTTKNWFLDSNGILRSQPLAAGKAATLTAAFTGPGVLAFSPEFVNAAAADTLIVKLGSTVLTSFDPVYVSATSKQTLTVTATAGRTSAGGNGYAALYPMGNGAPFDWTAVQAPELVTPADKGTSDAETVFLWKAAAAASDVNVQYVIWMDAATAKLGKAGCWSATNAASELTSCPHCMIPSFDATVGKTYYWRVDTQVLDGNGAVAMTVAGAARSYTMTDSAYSELSLSMNGNVLAPDEASGIVTVELQQGVLADMALSIATNATTTYKLASGKLPTGMTLKGAVLTGVPAASGEFVALLQATTGRQASKVLPVIFSVNPMGLAEGTFNGIASADEIRAFNGSTELDTPVDQLYAASVTITATKTGAATAKVLWGGATYSFTAKNFLSTTNVAETGETWLNVEFTSTTRIGTTTYTNVLAAALCAGTNTDYVALNSPAQLKSMALYAKGTAATDVIFATFSAGEDQVFYRDNSRIAAVTAAAAPWAGYYTIALPGDLDESGKPAGAGTLTITLTANGSATYTGVLPGGTKLTSSFKPAYVLDETTGEATQVIMPFYTATKTYFVAGSVLLNMDEDLGVPVATGSLIWNSADPRLTSNGSTFSMTLSVEGGWYDKLANIQAFYLGYGFSAVIGEDLLPSALDTTYTALAFWPSDYDLGVSLIGNTMTTDKRTLVKQTSNKTLNDFENSINPSNLQMKFTYATGLFTGSFGLWYQGTDAKGVTVQKELTATVTGILAPNKSSDSTYSEIPGLGYATVKQGTWNQSIPFSLEKAESETQEEGLPSGNDLE